MLRKSPAHGADKTMMKRFLSLFCSLSALALLLSCAPATPVSEKPGRACPVYIQWLEEQAGLRRASELTSIVSGSSLSWRRNSRESLLPEGVRTWFRASPVLTAWSGDRSFLSVFKEKGLPARLAGLGIQGVYFSGTADTGDEWAGHSPGTGLGEDATGLSFGRTVGKDEEYEALLAALSGAELPPGGELPPAHTGMGPDFFLALRSVRDYPGLYAMAEVPGELWPLLPEVKEHEQAALSPAQTAALAARGVMAPALVQDAPGFLPMPRGWAATGPVTGVDGVKRRWIYRWAEQPARPVLHWDDPSGAARRIMEAGLIRQAGLLHQVLAGLRAAAWMGLDALSSDSVPGEELEPGLSAVRTLARNAHRYGAALLLEDALPMEKLALLQRSGPDFCFDSVLFPALEQSLLEQNALPVKRSLRRSLRLGIDHRALWRGTADGLPRPSARTLLPLMPEGWERLLLPADGSKEPRLNAPTLAAMAAGVPPGKRPESALLPAVRDAHMLQIAVRAFLPGLLMLSGSDLSGGLPQGEDWPATPPLWQLDAVPSSRRGLPSGIALYRSAEADVQQTLKTMLSAREKCGIALGTLVQVPDCREKSVLIAASTLPSGGTLVFFGNVSAESVTFFADFPLWSRASSRSDLLSEAPVAAESMTLPPWGWRVVLLQ